ncbi:TPA: hypothetical protein QHP12_003467, partial [Morganella morganii subsp. morganii]|nr:hypothetical protein [Morganella morganii subsp. morganii]
VLLSDLFENLLVKIRVAGNYDSHNNTALLLHLAKAIERDSTESCVIYRMSPNEKRVRDVGSYLFQGAYPTTKSRRGEIYPGDSSIKDNNRVSVQIHFINLKCDGKVIINNVPVVAVWIPRRLACSIIVQHQS